MYKTVSRFLITTVMLVAFIGQALAFNTNVPCVTPVDSLSHNSSELVEQNELHTIKTERSEDCCGIKCCGVDCTCIINACSSIVYFNTGISSIKATEFSEIFYIQEFEQTNSISSLLYRPPIFTS